MADTAGFEKLSDWLSHIERVHPQSIALGLERVAEVRQALAIAPTFPIITVGGTNGKGSTCAMLEAILSSAGYRVGCYTSPHLLVYNERIRVECRPVADGELCAAFAEVESARGAVPLTYFEFGTLAAMRVFERHAVDVAILEVGLGGRLDAVNVFDADCAVITSVDLDHLDYLGDTREKIGREKAGIFRPDRPAVCAEPRVTASIREHARRIGARLLEIGRDFGSKMEERHWQYWGPWGMRFGLPYPALPGRYQVANASVCIAALDTLADRLPVRMCDIHAGLYGVALPGRFEVLPGRPTVVLDVAHNPHAATALAANLAATQPSGRTIAVFAMLRDKDIAGVVRAVRHCVDAWCVATIAEARGATAAHLRQILRQEGATGMIREHNDVAAAYLDALGRADEQDRIVVFGSFHTVAGVMRVRQALRGTVSRRAVPDPMLGLVG